MRRASHALAIPLVAAATFIGDAMAQVQSQTTPRPRLHGVEQMVEDISPLAVSLRSFQTDLRLPSGFDGVYRAPDDGTGGRLMRIDGALAAVFPQSIYAPLYVREQYMLLLSRERKVGYVPTVPAGTVFHIGLPETKAPPQQESRPLSQPELHVVQQPVARRAEAEVLVQRPVIERAVPADRSIQRHTRGSQQAQDRASAAHTEMSETPGGGEPSEAISEDRLRELLRRAVASERAARRL